MPNFFDQESYSQAFTVKGPATLVDAYFRPWTYNIKKDGSRVITFFKPALILSWLPDGAEKPVNSEFSAGSLSAKRDEDAEASGMGWFPSNDGETYCGDVDVDTIYEMASDGAVDEFDEEDFATDEDWRGVTLAPVPDANGNEPTQFAGTSGLAKFFGRLTDAEGFDMLADVIDPNDVSSLIGMRADVQPTDAAGKGPSFPVQILEAPEGAKGSSKKSGGKKKAGGSKKADESKKSGGKKSSSSKKSKGSKKAAVDEDAIEAAILEALQEKEELTAAQCMSAAKGIYEKTEKDERRAAMTLAGDESWMGDEERPWVYDDGTITLPEDE